MNPQAAKLVMEALEQAGQMRLPFMAKLKPSSMSQQPWRLAENLNRLATPRSMEQATPWERLKELAGGYWGRDIGSFTSAAEQPGAVKFRIQGPGSPSGIETVLRRPLMPTPKRAEVDVAESEATRTIGHGETKERSLGGAPPVDLTMQDRQRAFDAIARLLRQAGIDEIGYKAVPGARPRLYEKVTGYPQVQQGVSPESLFQRYTMNIRSPVQTEMKLGDVRRPREAAPSSAPAPEGSPLFSARRLLQPGSTVSREGMENMLGMSIDEALDTGLIQPTRSASLFTFTDRGRQFARTWRFPQ